MYREERTDPFAASATMPASALDATEGAELLANYESSPGVHRMFCKRCGSPLFSTHADDPQVVSIRAGIIDGPLRARPSAHYYVGQMADWWRIDDHLLLASRPSRCAAPARRQLAAGAIPAHRGAATRVHEVRVMDMSALQQRLDPLFPGLMGLRLRELAPERVLAELTVRPDLRGGGGVLHGGAIMAFADTLGAVGTVLNLPAGKRTTTTDSSTKFIAAARVDTVVTGESVALHRGRTTMVWQTSIRNADGGG